MVICAKKNGKPRRTIDFQPLNSHATRETYHTQSPFHQARSVPHGKKKTVFDAGNSYHSVPLHPDDRHYATFITPWGRYRYSTAPQGYTLLWGMVIPGFMMKLFCHSLRKPNVSTIHSIGQTLFMTAFFWQPGGLTFVDDMASLSTQTSLCLPRIMWNLRSQATPFALVKDILELLQSFLPPKT